MGLRIALRNWANKPSRAEIISLEKQKKDKAKQSNEESIQVRALNRQLKVVDDLLEQSYTQIKRMSDTIASHREGDWMDKLIDKGLDVVDNLFAKPKGNVIDITPGSNSHTIPQIQPPESADNSGTKETHTTLSGGYSSQEINELINKFDIEDLKKGAKAPYFLFSKSLKQHYPRATNENILEAYNLTQELAENGKQ